MKLTAQDYLAEKLQEKELALSVAYGSYNYWRSLALKGKSPEEAEEEIKKAMELGYYS